MRRACWSSQTPPGGQIFTWRYSVPANAYTSLRNFNFLARLVSEIWRGPKIVIGDCWSPQTPPSKQIFTWSYILVNAYQPTKFQLSSSISFRDKEWIPKFNVGLLSPLPCDNYSVRCCLVPCAYNDSPTCNSFLVYKKWNNALIKAHIIKYKFKIC